MPELPEVETSRRGIAPHLVGRRVAQVVLRQRQLRWPVPRNLGATLTGRRFVAVDRRGKYLLLSTAPAGTLILHLGMSGSLRILPADTPPQRHDHLDIVLEARQDETPGCLRLTDPRRFGAALWTASPPADHPLLRDLGPEPLDEAFDSTYLHQRARGRSGPVKNFLMDSKVVVGVGNIYANEALFLAGIHPARAAGKIGSGRYERLVQAVKEVLGAAIEQGGTTLRDFVDSSGRPGYFAQELNVYGREGAACPVCGSAIRRVVLGQRSTYYCSRCQR